MATPRLCSIPDCGKKHKAHGFCVLHFVRWKKTGDPLKARRYPPRGEPMKYLLAHMWDDCPKWPYARGRGGYGHIQYEGQVRDLHRLVCEMVNGPALFQDMDASHICGKGHEGCFGARCLSWKTKSSNMADRIGHGTEMRGEDVPNSKLTETQVIRIRKLAKTNTHQEIADQFGVSRPAISNVISRKTWDWLR